MWLWSVCRALAALSVARAGWMRIASISYTTIASSYGQMFDGLPSSGTFANQTTAGPFDFIAGPYNFPSSGPTDLTGWSLSDITAQMEREGQPIKVR